MLPDWTVWAAQRIGTPGGPLSEEYELTENELDWYDCPSASTSDAAHPQAALAGSSKRLS